jgi:hypothetical protein
MEFFLFFLISLSTAFLGWGMVDHQRTDACVDAARRIMTELLALRAGPPRGALNTTHWHGASSATAFGRALAFA